MTFNTTISVFIIDVLLNKESIYRTNAETYRNCVFGIFMLNSNNNNKYK